MNRITRKCLTLSFMLYVTTGCSSTKLYTNPEEFYSLPLAKQSELCLEWSGALSGIKNTTPTTYTVVYPNGSGYDAESELIASAATLGSSLAAYHSKMKLLKSGYNINYCSIRHFARDFPEEYSFYFLNKSKEIVLLRSEVDSLNIKATKLALDGDIKKAIEIIAQALALQENPYSYQIQAAIYIIAAQNEKVDYLKKNLLEKSIESSTDLIDRYGSDGDDYFLRGYAYYQLNQSGKAYKDFFACRKGSTCIGSGDNYESASLLYLSLLVCTESDVRKSVDEQDSILSIYKKGGGLYRKDSSHNNKDGSFSHGLYYLEMARMKANADGIRARQFLPEKLRNRFSSYDLWLKKSIDGTKRICEEYEDQEKQVGRRNLILPPEELFRYLDQIQYRGF